MSLADALKVARTYRPRATPLWTGPNGEGPNGGVTQGLIARWLADRERCRLYAMEGIRPNEVWEPRTGFGNMWHVCEEAHAKGPHAEPGWLNRLNNHASLECRKYPMQQDLIQHWYDVCRAQFPVYVEYWAEHPDVVDRTPLLQEQTFDVQYQLPSGRSVRLRGKWDSVDLIDGAVYLQENKTKSQIVPEQIRRQLTFDNQTMMYLIALSEDHDVAWQRVRERLPGRGRKPAALGGVRYNVIRRDCPIRRHQATAGSKCPKCKGAGGMCLKCGGVGRIGGKPAEDRQHFYDRLVDDYFRKEPEQWFMRWRSEVPEADRDRFRREFLDPVLEMMLDDHEWWQWVRRENGPGGSQDWDNFDYRRRGQVFPEHRLRHFRYPFGTYNVLQEGGSTDLDEHLDNGTMAGLTTVDVLFPELDTP